MHPYFDASTFENDYALLQLPYEPADESVTPVRMNRNGALPDAWLTSAGMSMHSLNEEEEQVDDSDEESDGDGGGNKAFLMMMEEEKKLTTIMMNLKKWKRNVVK